jgi:hypothetical protein
MIDSKKFNNELGKLSPGWIAMVETSADKIMDLNTAAVKFLTKKKYSVTVIAGIRPFNTLLSTYRSSGMDMAKIFIIDCVSKGQIKGLGQVKKSGNVKFVESLANLTDLSIAVDSSLKKLKGSKCLFIDSIAAFLIHNKPQSFTAFMHSILVKMRMNLVSGMLVSIEKGTDEKLRSDIMQLCDKVIKI